MSKAHISPEDYINYYVSTRGISIEDIGVAPIVVISWSAGVVKSLAEQAGAIRQKHWMGGDLNCLYTKGDFGQGVSFLHSMVGAPATVMLMEELIACGARAFIGLGWAGSLQPNITAGSLILPTNCISEEGTSAHYHSEVKPTANKNLKSGLLNAADSLNYNITVGKQWTTDAPYRELKEKVNRYAKLGVLGVEMETSAMYALGAFRGVKVCNLLTISDELFADWNPKFSSDEVSKGTNRAKEIILEALKSVSI